MKVDREYNNIKTQISKKAPNIPKAINAAPQAKVIRGGGGPKEEQK
jgi:hypothetical protein